MKKRNEMHGSGGKAAAMLDLWASVKRAGRDRAPAEHGEDDQREADGPARPGSRPAGAPAHAAAE